MPDFWEFPTVSMGLGPITALYQARFNRYLHNRQLNDTSESRVWAFLGDGECDEPETLGALSLASREQLDNLIFVVNCNLQRLDGPVRGNGKIIQELEAVFRGAGWNVIKVILGSKWDELLANDKDGVLLNKLNTTVDGEFQRYGTETGEYIRDHFFGPDPRLRQLVAHLSDDDLVNLPAWRPRLPQAVRGLQGGQREPRLRRPDGDPVQDDQGLDARPRLRGPQRHAPDQEDEQGAAAAAPRPAVPARRDPRVGARRRRHAVLPPGPGLDRVPVHDGAPPGARRLDPQASRALPPAGRRCPADAAFAELRKGSGGQAVSTTMGFTRLLRNLARDEKFGTLRRADHPRRGAHVRHGLAVPAAEDLRRRRARSTSRSTTTCCSATPSRPTARSSRRASPRPARRRASSPPARRTPPTPRRRCRSTPSIRCSASSASAT